MNNTEYFKQYGYANRPLKIDICTMITIIEATIFFSSVAYAIMTFQIVYAIIGWGIFLISSPLLIGRYAGESIEIFPHGKRRESKN